MKSVLRTASAVLSLCAIPAAAGELAVDAAVFGAQQSVTDVALSPSGNQLLYVEPGQASDETIYVVDLTSDAAPRALISANEAGSRLSGCHWSGETAIVCRIYGISTQAAGYVLDFTRVMSINVENGKAQMLSARADYNTYGIMQNGGSIVALDMAGEDGKMLMTRQFIKESSVNTRLFNDEEGLGVELIDPTNGRRRTVERPSTRASGYYADENGVIRLMAARELGDGGYDGSKVRYHYRPLGSDDWQPLSTVDYQPNQTVGFRPVAVDSASNVAYGFEGVDGYSALTSMSLDGSMTRKVILRRNDVDVDSLVRIGRSQRVIGVSYATEKRYVQYFDPELDRFASGIAKALPGTPQISILDANADESKILFAASSDVDPGMIYLFDKGTRQLAEMMPVRAGLEGRAMGEMKPITFTADDGTQIPGYLTLPPGSAGKALKAIVMPHGGPGSRDEWGFDWLVQFFAAQGYAVLQPNFRGSAGYGVDWFGRNGIQAWNVAIGDVNAAGRWLVQQGIADADSLAIVGWSYGGYAALQSQVVDASLYKAVVAIAPVTDFGLLKEESRNFTKRTLVNEFVGSGPHVVAGSPAQHADRFQSPVLLVHGTYDLNVSSNQSELMKSRLEGFGKQVDYLEFKGLDHGLRHSQARGIMLKRIGDFLNASLPQ